MDRYEFAGSPIDVPDIDEASSTLHGLKVTGDDDDPVTVRSIAFSHALHFGEDSTIENVYESIMQNWIASLPPETSVPIRRRKERLARRVATEVMLASTRIEQRTVQTTPTAAGLSLSQDSGIAMPSSSSQPLPVSSADTMSWKPSQLSAMSISSELQSQSQSQSQPASQSTAIADPLARLKKHLKFKDAEPVPSTEIPSSVSQLLAHWQPAVDPSTYDWEATERADRTENLDETSQKQAEKARKRKNRREKKQQRENELAARSQPSSQPAIPSSMFESSQAPLPSMPPTSPRSSPGPVQGGIDSSQRAYQSLTVPLPGVQSQVAPGRFGGRSDKKKKKKARISGF